MYKVDDIVIAGDSFCVWRWQPEDWPVHLMKLLTGEAVTPRGQGFSGSAWWSTRKCLINELSRNSAKVLVVCHTEPLRLWNDEDRPLNTRSVELYNTRNVKDYKCFIPEVENSAYSSEKIASAAAAYYQYLLSTDFHVWSTYAWYKELDELTVLYNIEKVIHLYCFPQSSLQGMGKEFYIFKNGITVSNILSNYSLNSGVEGGRNHFNTDLNIRLAEELYKTITSNIDNTLVTLNL
jgi:hypothetical protein